MTRCFSIDRIIRNLRVSPSFLLKSQFCHGVNGLVIRLCVNSAKNTIKNTSLLSGAVHLWVAKGMIGSSWACYHWLESQPIKWALEMQLIWNTLRFNQTVESPTIDWSHKIITVLTQPISWAPEKQPIENRVILTETVEIHPLIGMIGSTWARYLTLLTMLPLIRFTR